MPAKTAPIGTCDLCGEPIPREEWYTSKGAPRLYCSRLCRNTANSRAGADIRGEKARERVARGEWVNPADINPPDPARIGAAVSRFRRAEVEAGTWRNPALSDEARAKLSRPRKHSGALHSALEKLKAGCSVSDLTDEEAEAHRAYRQKLRDARRDELNAANRERYRRRQAKMTDEERVAQRQKWREANRRRKK